MIEAANSGHGMSLIFAMCAIIPVVAAGAISMYAIRKIIFIARTRKIYDIPDDTRKIHGAQIPTLGGIGIFIGYIITAAFFWPVRDHYMPYVLASSVILFFTGIYDDIMNMRPAKKLVAQLTASLITILFAHVYPDSFSGLPGGSGPTVWVSVAVTTICCTFYINVFNFIDGIDGLAGVMAVLYLGILGAFFACMGHPASAGISFALAGATAGLLYYNISPAKIYMGDTGSMFLGFTIFIFSVLFLQWYGESEASAANMLTPYIHSLGSAAMLIVGMLFLPVFDALRVFVLRASKGVSPLKADRRHLHYYLLDAGFSHGKSVLIILTTNIVLILVTWLMSGVFFIITLAVQTLICVLLVSLVSSIKNKRLKSLSQ